MVGQKVLDGAGVGGRLEADRPAYVVEADLAAFQRLGLERGIAVKDVARDRCRSVEIVERRRAERPIVGAAQRETGGELVAD